MPHFSRSELQTLERLRAGFLAARPGEDYWGDAATLALYDSTFGERIGWKWDAVLQELARRGWSPPAGPLVDWACGSGIAGRRVWQAWPGRFRSLALWDRSPRALRFATEAARRLPAPPETRLLAAGESLAGATVVLSHVLNELTPAALRQLLAQCGEAAALLWVEAGTHAESRRLVAEVRTPLLARGDWIPIGPCTHAAKCGLLAPEHARHWCHSFARPPATAFQEARWGEFSRALGIDLRAVPFSFLAMARPSSGSAGPVGASRVLGHPREYKGYLKVLSCQAEGVDEPMLQKREAPELWRQVREERAGPLFQWQRREGRIVGGLPGTS